MKQPQRLKKMQALHLIGTTEVFFPSGIFQAQSVMAFASAIAKDKNVDEFTRIKAEEALRGDKNSLERQIQLLSSALDEIKKNENLTHGFYAQDSGSHEKRLENHLKAIDEKLKALAGSVQSVNLQVSIALDLKIREMKLFVVSTIVMVALTAGGVAGFIKTLAQ